MIAQKPSMSPNMRHSRTSTPQHTPNSDYVRGGGGRGGPVHARSRSSESPEIRSCNFGNHRAVMFVLAAVETHTVPHKPRPCMYRYHAQGCLPASTLKNLPSHFQNSVKGNTVHRVHRTANNDVKWKQITVTGTNF